MEAVPRVYYEDHEIIIPGKPFGMSSQDDLTGTGSLLQYFPGTHVITRLDKRVGGLMILAKNTVSAEKYTRLLQENLLEKVYHCVIGKRPEKEEETLLHWIKKESRARVFKEEVRGAKKAVLHYKVVRSSERYHLLEVRISTGRFHQIRAQLAAIGSPIVGDLKYGYKRSTPDGSLFLCCTRIVLAGISVEMPLPEVWGRYGV
ncbi:MAG: RNA pseudouridine synthase [Leadbetterella sp.]|nr:RNA pseudouridine synthase [Leadbetterella sp.]